MTINLAELKRAGQGGDLEPVMMTRRMVRAIAAELERSRQCVAYAASRDRVTQALQDLDREQGR